jgi:hypothetical protein
MPAMLLDFPIRAPGSRVYDVVSTPVRLDAWRTDRPAGQVPYAQRLGA